MRAHLVCFCLLMGCLNPVLAKDNAPAQVMLFGVFHFANPGLDKVKVDQINVMTAANQQYLQQLAERLADFAPTAVLLEFNPDNQSEIQQQYEAYLDGEFSLPANEIYQIGFRVAKAAGITQVVSFDEREIGWQADALFAQMPDKAPDSQVAFDALIAEVTAQQSQAQATLSLAELLKLANASEQDALNKYIYILTNDVGAGDGYAGADAAASWWHRNFRMYANIQQQAQPGSRVLAIGGQGHTAILKDLLALDRQRRAVDVEPYL